LGLRFRTEAPISSTLTVIFSFFCGIVIPVYFLPKPLIYFSYAIPYTWTIDLFRASLLPTNPLLPPSQEFLILLISTVLCLALGKLCLLYTIKILRKKKVIIK